MICIRTAALVRSLAIFLAVLVSLCTFLSAQSGITSGSVSGMVEDSSGAAVPGANIQLRSPDGAVQRNAVSDASGAFTLFEVPSGAFALTVSAPNFAAWHNASVAVAVGRDTRITVQLRPASASEQVRVNAQTDTIDTSQTSPVANIDRDRIEELPIPSRNYLNFALLSPALAAANPAQTQQAPGAEASGFSADGLRPSSNALYIDGSEDTDEYTGLPRTQLSPEAISDFQIVNHGYGAQFGGSAGGAVDVETRSGANLQHGDAFLFIQNGALNGTPPLEQAPHRPDENRLRVGLSTGGAIRQNRIFYYLAAEQEMAHGEEASDLSPATASQIESALAANGPLRGFHIQQGFFPTTNQETELSGRFDRSTTSNALMLRYAFTNNRSVNDAFNLDDLSDLSARGSAGFSDNSVNGSWSATLTPRTFNQLTFEIAHRRVDLRTGSTQEPGITIAGIARFGTPWTGNSRRNETHLDLGDNVVLQRGNHLLQAGLSLSHVTLASANRTGFAGLYVFRDLDALAAAQPDFYAQSFGDPNTSFAELRSAAWLSDHWKATRSLALDFGLRYEDNHLPSTLPQHPLNFSPRLGFAWSPTSRWVLRGGFGIFNDRYLLGTIDRIQEFNGTRGLQQVAEGPAAAALYQSGSTFASPHTNIAPSIWQAQPHLANPYAETASLGFERQLPMRWTLSGEYRFVHGVKLGRTINSNLTPPIVLTTQNAASLGVAAPTPQQIGRAVFSPQRINPAYDTINQFQTTAGSRYNGLTFTLNRQFTETFEMMAGYTLSRTTDDASFDTEQPQNPYAPAHERAPSLQDQRHRFVLSGLWVLGPDLDDPQDAAKAAHPNLFQKIAYGFEFAPILQAGSGFRDNALTGLDSNREHIYPFAARPLGYSRNALKTPPQVHADLRILRMVPIWRGHLDIVAESFNLLNRQNVVLLNPVFGSNATPQPSFATPIQEGDARRVQFSLDYEY